ncbi:MAG: DUF3467 domain-containing protein [Deltaproteobacteria bacterium]|nr:DUF3467 domain-containing protein [Deltaproteobacteria bacterium]
MNIQKKGDLMENKKVEMQIKASDDVLKGVYSNSAMIHHTQGEFVLDFITLFQPQGILSSRVIISPQHAKRLIQALSENIARYEKSFGEIREMEPPPSPTSLN